MLVDAMMDETIAESVGQREQKFSFFFLLLLFYFFNFISFKCEIIGRREKQKKKKKQRE